MRFLTEVQPQHRARFTELVATLINTYRAALTGVVDGPMSLMCQMRMGVGIRTQIVFSQGDRLRIEEIKASGTGLSGRVSPPTRQDWTLGDASGRDLSAMRWDLKVEAESCDLKQIGFDDMVAELLGFGSTVPGKTWSQVFKALVEHEAKQRDEAVSRELASSSPNYGSW